MDPATTSEGPVRPTLRCLREDLGITPPPINDPLHKLDHPVVRKVQMVPEEVAAGSAERIRSLTDRVWFKQRVGDYRAAVTSLLAEDPCRAGWWLGAAGARVAGSPDDFYAELEAAARRRAKGTPAEADTSWLLPGDEDQKRRKAEQALAAVASVKAVVRRLIARSLRAGGGWTAELRRHRISAHVRANDGEAYLVVCAEGFLDPNFIAVILASVPGVPADDWLAEPGGAVGIDPAPGQIIYSTLIPPDVQCAILEEFPEEGSL